MAAPLVSFPIPVTTQLASGGEDVLATFIWLAGVGMVGWLLSMILDLWLKSVKDDFKKAHDDAVSSLNSVRKGLWAWVKWIFTCDWDDKEAEPGTPSREKLMRQARRTHDEEVRLAELIRDEATKTCAKASAEAIRFCLG